MSADVDLLDELDDNCWCGRTEEECEEAGGCRWTQALAEREQSVRATIAEEIEAEEGEMKGLGLASAHGQWVNGYLARQRLDATIARGDQ
jgi:hypothetical protein